MPSRLGGGFPSRYPHSDPPELSDYTGEIAKAWDELAVKDSCELLCEPGRALVAEAESVVVRVDARRGNALYVNDGAFGTLFDAAFLGFRFPARLMSASGEQAKGERSSRSTVRPATVTIICPAPSCCRLRCRRAIISDRPDRRLRPGVGESFQWVRSI